MVYYADVAVADIQAVLAWYIVRAAKKEFVKLEYITSPIEAEWAAISGVIKHK